MKKLGLVCVCLALAACGSEPSQGPGAASGNNAPGNNAPGNNAPGNNAPGNNAPGNNAPGNNDPSGVTYHGEVRALIETRCVGCHNDGGVAPFTLTYDPQEWSDGPAWWVQSAALSVESGTMPPWKAAEDCREVEHTRTMPASEREVIAAWAEAGFAEGDPESFVAPPEGEIRDLPEFDLVLGAAEAYTPDLDRPDDYRCLMLEHTFDADTYVTGSMVLPGDTETVHHVLVYQIEPGDLDEILERDAEDPGVGYSCYGGAGGSGGPVAAWVPGSVPQIYPEGSAIFIPAGTRLVMQMHYNTLNVDQANEDATEIGLWTLPQGQTPQRQVVVAGFPNTGIMIPSGDPSSSHDRDFDLPAGVRIIGAAPHMHTLGTSIKSVIEHADGETSCVVDIPAWDFNWQQFYQFSPEAFLTTQPGDVHKLNCVYDNSVANQPVINGEQIEPRDVRWGEGTLDEMCLSYLMVDYPFEAEGTAQCTDWPDCVRGCGADDGQCYLGCLAGADSDCQSCLVSQTAQCARSGCSAELQGVTECLDTCGDGLFVCLTGECADPMDALYVCQRPELLGGQCNEELSECGVEF